MARLRVAGPDFARPRFSTRVAAFHVDALIFSVAFEVIHIILLRLFPEGVSSTVLTLVFIGVTFFVNVFPTKIFGQTLGKRLYGLKVLKSDVTAEPLTWAQCLQRELVLKTICSFALGLGFWRARNNLDGKAWHDSVTKTVVVSLKDEALNSTATKLLETGISLLTVLAGVGLTLLAFAYTSLPLAFFQEQLQTAGVAIEGIRGSLGGGLHFEKISKESMELRNVTLDISLLESWQQRAVVLNSFTAESGHFEVDAHFSWNVFATSFLATLVQHSIEAGSLDPESELEIDPAVPALKLRIRLLQLKDISLISQSLEQSRLLELKIENISLDSGVLSADTFSSRTAGLNLGGTQWEYSTGVLTMATFHGQLSASMIPLLKKPVGFKGHGKWALDDSQKKMTKLEAAVFDDHAQLSVEAGKVVLAVKGVPVAEYFQTRLPLQSLDLHLEGAGKTLVELLMASHLNYTVDFCGRHDVVISLANPGTFLTAVFTEKDRLENLFEFRPAPTQPALTGETSPAFCAAPPNSAVSSVLATTSSSVLATTSSSVTSTLSLEAFRAQVKRVDGVFRSGKMEPAINGIEALGNTPSGLPTSELGNFHSLKAWIYLYSKKPAQAADYFKQAYQENADVSNIEGLIRSEEASPTPDKNQIDAWTALLRKTAKENPSAALRLTPDYRKRFGL